MGNRTESAIAQRLTRIESDWRANYQSTATAYEQQEEEYELRHAAWRKHYKTSAKNGKSASGSAAGASTSKPVACRSWEEYGLRDFARTRQLL